MDESAFVGVVLAHQICHGIRDALLRKEHNSVVRFFLLFSFRKSNPHDPNWLHQARKTYKSATDDDAESVVLGVVDDVIAGHECCPLVKVPHDHVLLPELKVVHHVLAI